MLLKRIDRYLLGLSLGTLGGVVSLMMFLMVLEHIPRLVEVTRLSGHRGYIVGQTVLGLLPEYSGIGAVVGVYLAVAMAIRKLSVRGELAVIEATGTGPWRWMRMPLLLTLLGAVFVLGNQGWMQPHGERKLAEIGHRMAIGDFGFNLAAGEFNHLGGEVMVYFDRIDEATGDLQGLIFVDDEQTYNATSGSLSLAPDGEGVILLSDGQAIDRGNGNTGVMQFSEISFHVPGVDQLEEDPASPSHRFRTHDLPDLLSSDTAGARAAGYARLLWVVLVLLTPGIAYVLARPPMRSTSAVGLLAGLCLLIAFLKSISLVDSDTFGDPAVAALVVVGAWTALVAALHRWQRRAGFGAFDRLLVQAFEALAQRFSSPRHLAAA